MLGRRAHYSGQVLHRIEAEQRPEIERILLERMVLQLIDTKLLFADFRRTLPPENLKQVEKTLAEPFEASEIPKLLDPRALTEPA